MSSPTSVLPSTPPTSRGDNPFVGPRSIRQGEKIHGRRREILELRDRLIADRIVLMYSPSGAGKTSLINAGLIPQLEARGFVVLPPIRVNHVDDQLGGLGVANRYRLSTMLSLEAEAETPLDPATLPSMTLSAYLDRIAARSEGHHDHCLIFDQFEELLTLDQADLGAKADFMRELGFALRDRGWWALFSMREDFVAPLDAYLDSIPTRLSSHYRLELLSAEAATAAARDAAEDAGVHFAEAAADKLITDLRRVRVQRGDEVSETPGPYVEPVQLQVVCSQLWDKLEPTARRIDLVDVVDLGDVDDALGGYYEQRVGAAAVESGVSEREIRQWIEDALITEQGFRTQSLAWTREGADAALASLENSHLIRTETHRGARWYELSHDRLVDPVLTHNAQWRSRHLSILQARAGEWYKHEKPTGLLIGGPVLAQAEQWAKENPGELNVIDREYLAKCLAQEESARKLRTRSRAILVVAVVAGFLFVVALGLWFRTRASEQNALDARNEAIDARNDAIDARNDAIEAREEAEAEKLRADELRAEAVELKDEAEQARAEAELQERKARAGALAAQSRAVRLENAALGLAIAAESTAIADEPLDATFAAIAGARSEFRSRTWQPVFQSIEQFGADEVAVSPDGTLIASTGCANPGATTPCERDEITTIYIRSFDDPFGDPRALTGHTDEIRDLAFSSAGVLASASKDNTVRLWNAATGEQLAAFGPDDADGGASYVNTLDFHSTDPDLLATGDELGRVWLWNLGGDQPIGTLFDRGGAPQPDVVHDVAWRFDGKLIASAESSGDVVLWDATVQRAIRQLSYPGLLVDGERIEREEILQARRVEFYDEPQPVECPEQRGLRGCVDVLVAGHQDGVMWFWESPNRSDEPPLAIELVGHTEDIGGLSFDRGDDATPEFGVLASAGGDRTIRLWRFEKLDDGSRAVTPIGEPLSEHSENVTDVVFTPDGTRLVSAGTDHTVRLWGQPVDVGIRPIGGPIECDDPDATCFATAVAFSPGDRLLASTGFDGMFRVTDPRTGEPAYPPVDAGGAMYAVAFHPTEDIAIIGGHGRIWRWDATSPEVLEPLWTDRNAVAAEQGDFELRDVPAARAVAFDASTGNAAAADECGVIRIFDPSGRQLDELAATGDPACSDEYDRRTNKTVDALEFVDGALLFGDHQGTVWTVPVDDDGQLGVRRSISRQQNGNVRGLDVSDDGLIASGSRDQTIRVWDPADPGRAPRRLKGHKAEVSAVAFSDDYLASASNDGTIRLWWISTGSTRIDALPATGEALASSRVCKDADACLVNGIAFSSDSSMLASATSDGMVYIWDRPIDPDYACELAMPFITADQVLAQLDEDAQSRCFPPAG